MPSLSSACVIRCAGIHLCDTVSALTTPRIYQADLRFEGIYVGKFEDGKSDNSVPSEVGKAGKGEKVDKGEKVGNSDELWAAPGPLWWNEGGGSQIDTGGNSQGQGRGQGASVGGRSGAAASAGDNDNDVNGERGDGHTGGDADGGDADGGDADGGDADGDVDGDADGDGDVPSWKSWTASERSSFRKGMHEHGRDFEEIARTLVQSR